MATAGRLDLTVFDGDIYSVELHFVDTNEATVDLSAASLTAAIRRATWDPDPTVLFTIDDTFANTGIFTLSLTADQTAELPALGNWTLFDASTDRTLLAGTVLRTRDAPASLQTHTITIEPEVVRVISTEVMGAAALANKVDTPGAQLTKSGTTLSLKPLILGSARYRDLPDPAAHTGELHRTGDGGTYQSNGTTWVTAVGVAGGGVNLRDCAPWADGVTDDWPALANADAAALFAGRHIDITAGTYRIAGTHTVQSPTRIAADVVLVVDAGAALTFAKPVEAPPFTTVFGGSGQVKLALPQTAHPDWWGAKLAGDTVHRAWAAIPQGAALVGAGKYRISTPLIFAFNEDTGQGDQGKALLAAAMLGVRTRTTSGNWGAELVLADGVGCDILVLRGTKRSNGATARCAIKIDGWKLDGRKSTQPAVVARGNLNVTSGNGVINDSGANASWVGRRVDARTVDLVTPGSNPTTTLAVIPPGATITAVVPGVSFTISPVPTATGNYDIVIGDSACLVLSQVKDLDGGKLLFDAPKGKAVDSQGPSNQVEFDQWESMNAGTTDVAVDLGRAADGHGNRLLIGVSGGDAVKIGGAFCIVDGHAYLCAGVAAKFTGSRGRILNWRTNDNGGAGAWFTGTAQHCSIALMSARGNGFSDSLADRQRAGVYFSGGAHDNTVGLLDIVDQPQTRTISDGATTMDVAELNSPAQANFTQADVDNQVPIFHANFPVGTYITEWVSSTKVLTSQPAIATGSGLTVKLGSLPLYGVSWDDNTTGARNRVLDYCGGPGSLGYSYLPSNLPPNNGIVLINGEPGSLASSEPGKQLGNSGSAQDLDWAIATSFDTALTANCTFTIKNPPASGRANTLTVAVTVDGSHTVAFTPPAGMTIKWLNGTGQPQGSSVAGTVDIYTFSQIAGNNGVLYAAVAKGFA